MTKRIVEMIQDIEEGRREMSWDNIEELRKISRFKNRAQDENPCH